MMRIRPQEDRCLLPAIKQSKTVTLHQVQDPGAIDIPDALQMELNLFAGQLYVESFLAVPPS
ncbi:unnamed protein product [Penicillium camemberti]|uniref:Str. FM013 n=1 Tax=Penicillium camemberti (strain FM 013) TaxID=1429867 RepID=A0A0G4PSM1_PENC3|nr:unnamed protein product [Penicillium camemberti]